MVTSASVTEYPRHGGSDPWDFVHRSLPIFPSLFFLFCSSDEITSIFFFFLGPHPWHHMEVPRLGVKSELQLPAYPTAAAMQDPSCVCKLHHSSWQRRIPNPLRRPGIEPASSRKLVGFVSAEPRGELLRGLLLSTS